MTTATKGKIPSHLKPFIVEQDYSRYTPEDQAVWRFIMRQLKNFLSEHAHESYLDGLVKTGITVDRIPEIVRIDEHLERIGWGAVAVSGFIPPAAFMEFQSLGILPIACDMRTLDHLLYTPAPDIVHEAAGHAPILANPDYAAYLRKYGEIARHAILSREDLEQYEAIRILSDVKENPESTPQDIAAAELRLEEINGKISYTSEAALLSRMNWWTAEYGLIGSLNSPRIFGAGLLSSVGESKHCLSPSVRKIPLTVDCVEFSYDITEPQPQLFVANDFAQLGEVLEKLASRLAYRRGGEIGLKRAIQSETVNTVVLNSGLQIAGRLRNYLIDEQGNPCYLQFEGPSQLAVDGRELPHQGLAHHPHGYSCPLGNLKNGELESVKVQQRATLEFESGVRVEGVVKNLLRQNGVLVLITFLDCRVTRGDQLLFDPSWGEYDMAVGHHVPSVFGGPADREKFGLADEFVAKRVPPRTYDPKTRQRHALYAQIRDLRERRGAAPQDAEFVRCLAAEYLKGDYEWLAGLELLELCFRFQVNGSVRAALEAHLMPERLSSDSARQALTDGLKLAQKVI